jgi:predicted dehydrogenase/nucleoside-diphosphate-sugar epimerase
MTYVILGGGAVATEFYLPALHRLGLAGGLTVVDPFEASRAALTRSFPDVRTVNQGHAEFLSALTGKGDERVVITLPNPLHVEAAQMALARRRHVLCEKPLALKAADCDRLAEDARSAERLLKVAMSRRYLASMMLARHMVRAGELGAVREVEVRDCIEFLWRPRSFAFFARESGGVLADMGVHYLDFLDTLLGPLKPVAYSDDSRGGTESSADYRLEANGVPARLVLSRLYAGDTFITIRCERGEIRIDKTQETSVTVTPHGSATRTVSVAHPFDDPSWPADFHGSFTQMLADFERAIAGQATPIADVEDAARATRLIEWAYASRGPQAQVKPSADTVLVTGATGFIGGHLVDRLTAQGVRVRASARTPGTLANLARFAAEAVPTDILDPGSVTAALGEARTVYHLAYGKEGDAARITIEGTKAVVEAAIAKGVESVVVLSTMYVFGFPGGDRPVDETFPYRPYGGEYGQSKAQMEQWCLERAKTSGATRITVVNPTCVYGPGGGAYTALPVDMAREGRFAWISEGSGSCNYIYVDNVVDALLAAAAAPAAHGERFILNDGTTTWRGLLEPMLAPLGRDIPSYSPAELNALPRFGGPFRWSDLARAAISSERVRDVAKRSASVRRLFERAGRRAAQRGQEAHVFTYRPAAATAAPVFPPEWLAELYSPAKASFSAAKAERVLDWKPRVDLQEGLDRSIAWLRATGRLPPLRP